MLKTKATPKNPESFRTLDPVYHGFDNLSHVFPTWEKALQKELKSFWESIKNDVSK